MAPVYKRRRWIRARKKSGREVLKKLWKNSRFVETINKSHIHPSRQQISVFKSISAHGISGHKQEYSFFTFSIDIAFPKKKLAIEVDGAHWHKKRNRRDKRKGRLLKRCGWRLLRISADNFREERSRVIPWLWRHRL